MPIPVAAGTTTRNPVWASTNSKAMPDLPSGHVDAIRIKIVSNPATQVNDIETGKADWMKAPPPPDRIAEIEKKYEGTQFRSEPTISNFYFWMNTQKPPFDDLRVRRAVNYAIDPAALERIYSGTLRATQQILPPGMPGYRKYAPYPHDLAKARELIARADPTDRNVTVWTDNYSPNDEAGEYYESVLRKLGFHTDAEGGRRRRLLRRDRQRLDPRPRHGLVELAARLPPSQRLLPAPARGRKHPARKQHQLGPVRRPAHQRENRPARPRTARPAADPRILRSSIAK